MRIMINEYANGWLMTGLLGAYARWFIGFSYQYGIPEKIKTKKPPVKEADP